jgi:hypothetical protein
MVRRAAAQDRLWTTLDVAAGAGSYPHRGPQGQLTPHIEQQHYACISGDGRTVFFHYENTRGGTTPGVAGAAFVALRT